LSLHVDQSAILFGCLVPSLIIAYTDTRFYIIPDKVSLPVMLAGLVAAVYKGNLAEAFLGAAIGFGILFLLAALGGAGGGDAKYAAGLGMWFGVNVLMVLFWASVVGLMWGITKLIRRGELKQRAGLFFRGIFLRLICNVRGSAIIPKLSETPSAPVPPGAVPFGACLALAAWAVQMVR